ncbi:hypothetical protein ACFX14_034028 [Malus domestica]
MASAVLDLLIGRVGAFLISEASLLGGVHDELEETRLELLAMKAFLADAERSGKNMGGKSEGRVHCG